MAHLIDKSSLVAEIEKKIKQYEMAFDNPSFASYEASLIAKGKYRKLLDILQFLDTLEAKEVDLEKETLCDKCKKAQPSHSCQDITALGRCALEKQGEQKPAWSEEDEAMWTEISDLLWEGYKQSGSKFSWDDIRNWVNSKLKSLTPQSTWKPSDEQIEALEHFIVYHNGSTNYAKDLEELRLQLKKLREE